MCGQQRNSPMADPIFGSKYGPQNGVQNWITFSFLLLGLCLGPVLGSRFGPKSGVSHRRILLLPAEVLQADLRRTSMSVSVNSCLFSLCVPLCFLCSTLYQCGSGRLDPLQTRQTCQRDKATGQPRKTNQQTNSGTNQPPNATGGRKSLWRVLGAGGPLQSLVILEAGIRHSPPNQHQDGKSRPKTPDKNETNNHNKKPKKGQQTTHQNTQAAKRAEKAKERTGTREKTAGGGQQQQDKEGAREGSKDRREEAAQAKEKGACSSSGVLRGVLDHPRVNTGEDHFLESKKPMGLRPRK